jgi:hypothetical protein
MIRHIVLARFPADLPADEIAGLFADLRAAKDRIAGIQAVHAGPNVSGEGYDRGYTHLFTIDFADAAALAAYLPHPAHGPISHRLVAAAGGIDNILVVDLEL